MSTPRSKPQSRKKPKLDMDGITKAFTVFRQAKNAEITAKAVHERLRDTALMPAVAAFGHTYGDKGQHLAIDLPEEIDGFTRLVRRTKSSQFLNIDRAEALAAERGFLPQVQVTTVTITGVPAEKEGELLTLLEAADLGRFGLVQVRTAFDQERLYAFHQTHREPTTLGDAQYLTEGDMDSLLDTDVSYAFHPEKSS